MLFGKILLALNGTQKEIQIYAKNLVPQTKSLRECVMATEFHDREVIKVKNRKTDKYVYIELADDVNSL